MSKLRTIVIALTVAFVAAVPFAAPALADGTAIRGGTSRPTCLALGMYYNNGIGTSSGCVSAPSYRQDFSGVQKYDHVFWTNTLRDSGMRSW